MELRIDPCGTVHTIYDEAIDLRLLGQLHITRGSHVEPDKDGQWLVDLSPANGPTLGPFSKRSQALAAEREWLEKYWLPGSAG